ncbi:MAG: DNA translocase FtsK [Acidobacteria bacterium]|nr:DNA translocase FtsK [Acidobacteriota bacterium]
MKLLGPTSHHRLNEAAAVVFLFAGIYLMLALASHEPLDPSWNTATGAANAGNLVGVFGSFASDLLLQTFGLAAFLLPPLVFALAWNWVRSKPIEAPFIRVFGSLMLVLAGGVLASLMPSWRLYRGTVAAGGVIGTLLTDFLLVRMNLTGTILFAALTIVVSLYLISTFDLAALRRWLSYPVMLWHAVTGRMPRVRMPRFRWPRLNLFARKKKVVAERVTLQPDSARVQVRERLMPEPEFDAASTAGEVPWYEEHIPSAAPEPEPLEVEAEPEIPIHVLADEPDPAEAMAATAPAGAPAPRRKEPVRRALYSLPPTSMLNEPPGRNTFDSQELKDTAGRIKGKFEEFNVLGNVTQINPGPVVTTFEFKPEAGIKYSRITTLTEDLCLGLQAESILIERIPGKPTVGIEVPNRQREVISLRQILESDEFTGAPSHLTIALGKDINGRIKVASLETMPHLLVAGSTGSGKSVMLNSMIMSILFKSTPDEVRMIMVDPKRLEFGLYEGIPHLLTPVITDPRKATNALKNAVLEMERRLKLLASQGVRNIDQFNRKMRQLAASPRSLFADQEEAQTEDNRPLPYILILIDELADLMMLERAGVEESVARLAQMARAVGMHLVLATQRPSVDVITGLIKANFPARISFRVATRVDSRTILDVMGAEHLLGKGDMLFLPPGSSRLTRVHGAFVTEAETNDVVEYWKQQAAPEYDQSFLLAPPSEDGEENGEEFEGEQDPAYEDAVRVVCEMGKASTSTLQRRLRLGYGRAARILDRMHKEGIIGPPDGSRPRELLRRPEWLGEMVR